MKFLTSNYGYTIFNFVYSETVTVFNGKLKWFDYGRMSDAGINSSCDVSAAAAAVAAAAVL